MRKILSFTVVAAACLAAACAEVPESMPAPAAASDGELERLYSVRIEAGGVRVRAPSRGCTDKDSFDVVADRSGMSGQAYSVSFMRTKPDECSGPPLANGVQLFFSRSEIGLPPGVRIIVANPVGMTGT